MAAAEVAPLAKTGGLADVTAALCNYLHEAGHDVKLLMPRYARLEDQQLDIEPVPELQGLSMQVGPWQISYAIDWTILPGTNMPVYLLNCPILYSRPDIYTSDNDEHLRFILLSRAAIEMCQHLKFAVDVLHCHDWHTALMPLFLKSRYAWDQLFDQTKTALTIHNIGYQGKFTADILNDLGLGHDEHLLHQDDLQSGVINLLKTGVLHADAVTTVSPTYAYEILGSEYGMGLEGILQERKSTLIGILNGVDYQQWSPQTDTLIPANYSTNKMEGKAVCKQTLVQDLGLEFHPDRPLVGCVTRLASQKGIDLIMQSLPTLLRRRDFTFIVLGSGETRYEQFFEALQHEFPRRVCFYRGYNEGLSHMIEAGSDLFLMPSLYEPCGLNQMYSLRYGTVPIVRKTGGLADSVELIDAQAGTGTGIVFRDYNEAGLTWALNMGLSLYSVKPLWRQIVKNGMHKDFSWARQGNIYVELYHAMLRR